MAARGPIDLHESLARVARGGIPLRAEERLAEEAGPHGRLFTSDLSVSEFLLARDAQCQPISQVMGSSIYHVGQIADLKDRTEEVAIISDAHREARQRALSRLTQEAALVGADAVIGAQLGERMVTMGARGKGGDDGGEVIEFTVVGTAVRAPWITHRPGEPIVTDLSGQDLWTLAQDGFEPCCFLFEFCRYHSWHVASTAPPVGELVEAYQAVEQARRIAADRLTAQAARHGAEFVVGSNVRVEVREVPCGLENCALDDLDVELEWFGTGIRRIPNAARRELDVPPLVLSMVPLGRRKDAFIGAEDDADEVRRAAEDAQEIALELTEFRRR